MNSLNDAVDRDGLILLANSFQPANTDRIAATRTEIAQRVRTLFQPFRSAIIDNTTVEILAIGDGPVAICIAVDRCETGFGPVLSQTTTNPVLMFNFENPDGSRDVYGLLTGTFDRLEPSDGISVTTENTPDGTWVHAHRPAHIEGGDVRVINPSPELNDLLGFNV